MGVGRADFSDTVNWQTPQELPDLRRVGIVALDAETNDRAKAVTALTHRLLADETLRQALVAPIIRNIAAGSIATVVHHRRGAG